MNDKKDLEGQGNILLWSLYSPCLYTRAAAWPCIVAQKKLSVGGEDMREDRQDCVALLISRSLFSHLHSTRQIQTLSSSFPKTSRLKKATEMIWRWWSGSLLSCWLETFHYWLVYTYPLYLNLPSVLIVLHSSSPFSATKCSEVITT